MTKETCNIIRACKGSLNEDFTKMIGKNTCLDRVKIYLSQEYENDIELYTDEQMEKIMYQAMGDYLDTCDKPSAFIYLMANLSDLDNHRISIAEQIALAFMWVQVRSKHTYINGFKQEFFDNSK